jgi:hypothetical protein
MSDFIEQQVIVAVKKLLTGRVNEIIESRQFFCPIIEFGSFASSTVVTPSVALAGCEQTEKERIIKLDAYLITINFNFDDSLDSELYCYSFSSAVEKALKEDVTLGGVADRATISGKKYTPPKNKGCGEGWALSLNLRVTVEGMNI